MNPNDPQQNPFNSGNDQNTAPQDPTPGAAPVTPGQDWSQQPTDPTAGQPQAFAPQPSAAQTPTPTMGDMSGSTMPSPNMSTPGQMPTPMPGQSNVMPGMPMQSPQGDNSKKRRMVMFAVLLLALVALVGGSWVIVKSYQKNHTKNTTNNAAKKSTSSTSAPDINTLASFTFVQPPASKLTGYTVTAGSTAGETNISAPIGSDTNVACVISYGIFNQADLPGTDIGDVVSKETVLLKNNGVSVTGPNAIKALVLKNASTSATYSIPSVSFSYTKDSVTEVADYSISELKNSTHAAILQVCAGKDTAANLTTKLSTELAPVAAAIGVKTQ